MSIRIITQNITFVHGFLCMYRYIYCIFIQISLKVVPDSAVKKRTVIGSGNGLVLYRRAIILTNDALVYMRHRFSMCQAGCITIYDGVTGPQSHYNDVMMSATASQITSITIVYSRLRSKKTSKLRVTGLCEESPSVIGEFPAQKASNAENVSIWWCHHELRSRVGWIVEGDRDRTA